MKRLVALLAIAFLGLVAAGPTSVSPENEPAPGDNNPRIDPSEIIAPAMDYEDAGWVPYYKWAENPDTTKCYGNRTCEEYKAEAKSESNTTTESVGK